MRRFISAASVGVLIAAGALIGAPAASAADAGMVYIIHGIPDTPVDVYVDGAKALDDFQPGTVKGPLSLPAGSHKVAITAADATDASNPVLSGDATITAGSNVSLIAHLSASGAPTLTALVDDVSMIPAGQARVVVRHLAAAPAVDVRAGGKVVLAGVTNPRQGALIVPAGTISADVTLAGTDTVAIGPADLSLTAGTATFVHAIGKADGGKLSLVVFTISDLGGMPGGVPAGTGPKDSSLPLALVLALLLGGTVLALSGGRSLMGRKLSGSPMGEGR